MLSSAELALGRMSAAKCVCAVLNRLSLQVGQNVRLSGGLGLERGDSHLMEAACSNAFIYHAST